MEREQGFNHAMKQQTLSCPEMDKRANKQTSEANKDALTDLERSSCLEAKQYRQVGAQSTATLRLVID